MANGAFSPIEIKRLIKNYREKLENMRIPITAIYLYGSYVKGKMRSESDVDVCVVSPAFKDRIESTMTLMKIRDDDELIISPIAFSPESFIDENPLVWEIKQTGIVYN